MISIICCYNNKKQFNTMMKSLASQNVKYEVIGIDNCNNRFTSASRALNFGASHANGDILVFLHQDIVFNSSSSLENFIEVVSDYDAIVGLYGASRKSNQFEDDLYIVDTLDECCIGMTRSMWEKYKFNESLCDNWHLYSVELCIRAKSDGKLIVTGNFDISHLSVGNVNEAYMATFKRLIKEYKNIGWVCTTCKSLPTNSFAFYCYYMPWKIKRIILGNYPLISILRKQGRILKKNISQFFS